MNNNNNNNVIDGGRKRNRDDGDGDDRGLFEAGEPLQEAVFQQHGRVLDSDTTQNGLASVARGPTMNNISNAALMAQYGLGGGGQQGIGGNQALLGLGGSFSTGLPFQQQLGGPNNLGMSQGLAGANFQQQQQQQQQQSQPVQQGMQGLSTRDLLRNLLLTNQHSNLALERALRDAGGAGALNMLVQQQQQGGGAVNSFRPDPPVENNHMTALLALQAHMPQFQPNGPPALAPPAAARMNPSSLIGHRVDNSGIRRILLYVPSDDESISPYQCFARQNIELFEAQEVDVQTGAQGRNKPVQLGQVGIRCIHCSDLHPKLRTRAAVYYPSRLSVLYQAAQNVVNVHLPELCESIPEHIRAKLVSLDNKRSSVGGGKNYWSDTAQIQGIVDNGNGLRFQDKDSADGDE